jgi:DNA-binding protein H-NS
MTTNRELRQKPLRDLLALQHKVSVLIRTKRDQSAKARQRVVNLASKLGVSVRELVGLTSTRGPDKQPRKSRALTKTTKSTSSSAKTTASRKATRKTSRTITNPDDPSESWNGRGRPPLWWKNMQKNGSAGAALHS